MDDLRGQNQMRTTNLKSNMKDVFNVKQINIIQQNY